MSGWFFTLLFVLAACRPAGSNTPAADGEGKDSVVELTSLFGGIPSVYEYEMRKATDEARVQTGGDDPEAVKSIIMDQADSIFHVAEQRAYPLAAAMRGALVHYAIDANVGYTLTSDIRVVCAILPKLSSMGDGAEEVDVKFSLRADSGVTRGYYVLTGTEGDVSVGDFKISVPNDTTKMLLEIFAPNVPAAILDNVSRIHFISREVYDSLYTKLDDAQGLWREVYRRTNGLE